MSLELGEKVRAEGIHPDASAWIWGEVQACKSSPKGWIEGGEQGPRARDAEILGPETQRTPIQGA